MLVRLILLLGSLEFLVSPLAFGSIWEMAQAAILSGLALGWFLGGRSRKPLSIVSGVQTPPKASTQDQAKRSRRMAA